MEFVKAVAISEEDLEVLRDQLQQYCRNDENLLKVQEILVEYPFLLNEIPTFQVTIETTLYLSNFLIRFIHSI
jgi:hypothetical protein